MRQPMSTAARIAVGRHTPPIATAAVARQPGYAAQPGATPGPPTSANIGASVLPAANVCFWIAAAYLIVDYGRPQNWFPPLAYIRPGMLTLGAGIVALALNQALPTDKLSKYVMAFFAAMVVAVPFATNQHKAFNETLGFGLFVFGGLLPLVAFVDSYERLRTMMRLWVAIHVSLAVYSITHQGFGIGSFLTDENDFALAMNVAIPYAYALFVLETKVAHRLMALAATLIMFVATTVTLSRGGFIGLVCIVVMLWFSSKRRVIALVGAAILAGLIYVAAPSSYWHEVESISTASEKGDTGYQRLYSWGIGWEMFLDNPILGVGPANYPVRAAEYETGTSDEIGYHMWGRVAHSLYFTLLPELGSIGTIIFAGMLFTGVRLRRRVRKLSRDSPGASPSEIEQRRWYLQLALSIDASMVGFLSTGAFISVLYYPHIWVLTGFTAVLIHLALRPAESRDILTTAAVAGPGLERFAPRSSVVVRRPGSRVL
jgi:probable O-glycosylation ligase (exosortase A-associated)